jgi:glyoxylase-like metal-dependent hydrolase (beta-lactamase superfamily II)
MATGDAVFLASLAWLAAAAAPGAVGSPSAKIAPGIELLGGAFLPERGPDGNTVVIEAPQGLLVIDTGRHAWHSDAILALARARNRPIAAVVNTHWHLDHTSGNGRIKAAFPGAPVYATNAVDRVLAEGGFLARNLESSRRMLDDPKLSDTQKEEVGIFIATMAERELLRPDVIVQGSGEKSIAGRTFDVRVTAGAVTDADIWLYDGASGVAVIGDLVTLPAPFFETACPAAWRKALDEVWSLPFKTAIPGHGEPMDREQFDTWRGAFNSYMDCVEGDSEAGQCAAAWADGIASLNGTHEPARKMARGYAEYYVGMLRDNGGRSADCLAR